MLGKVSKGIIAMYFIGPQYSLGNSKIIHILRSGVFSGLLANKAFTKQVTIGIVVGYQRLP